MGAIGVGTVNNWAGGTATMLLGLNQYYQGKKELKNNQRPVYQIPDEVRQNLSQAQQQALQGLPAEQQQQFINNIQRSSAYGLNQLGSRNSGLAGVSTMNQNQNDAYGKLLSMDSQARMQNQAGLMNARQNVADYRDQAFQVNQENPYYEKQAEGEAMRGAGMQNVAAGYQIAGSGSTSNNVNPYSGQAGQSGLMKQQPTSNQFGQMGQQGNMYNYNPNSNPQGIVPDGQQSMGSYA
jgi:hypothetical protein